MFILEYRKFIIVLVLLLSILYSASQKNQYQFNQINIENGLSNNSITCVFKDKIGFLWIGTTDGLNRYDGYSFLIFKNNLSDSNSISDNFISGIIQDTSGNLWIGTQGGGLNKYNPYTERFTTFYHDPENENSISSNFIFHHNALLIDENNTIWIGTNYGLCSYNLNNEKFTRYLLKSKNHDQDEFKDVRVIYEDNKYVLWIGTNSGLVRYNKNTGETKVFMHDNKKQNSISNNIITSISKNEKTNELWIGTENGLNIYNEEKEMFTRLYSKPGNEISISDNSITSIVKDETGNFWIGTKSGGLNRYDALQNKFIHWKHDPINSNSLSDNYVDYLYYDNNDLLWIGTVNNGINVLDTKKKLFTLIKSDPTNKNSLSYNTIRSIFEDKKGNIWIGTYGGGLNKYKNNRFSHFYHQPDNPNTISHNIVSALNEDNYGNLWIGTWGGGMNIMDLKTYNITRNYPKVPEFINDIYIDNKEKIWIGCNGGLFVYDQKDKKINRFDSEQNIKRTLTATSVIKILKDKKGCIWVGTWDGLNKIILNPNKLEPDTIIYYKKNPSDINSLSDNRIITLYEDTRTNLWIGTHGGGLNKIIYNNSNKQDKPSVQFKYYTDVDGLAGNTIYGILEDNEGNLWISTNNGLSRFNTKDEIFNNFDVDDGLQGNQFYWHAYMKSTSGEMYFGGINGLNVFHPDSIKYNQGFPKIILTDLLLFNKSVKVGGSENGRNILEKSILYTDKITLTRKDYSFTFEFAALSYRSQNKIKYAYQLGNFDPYWVYTDSKKRYATYSHLRPGDYLFKIKSTNEDGIWNNEFIKIEITILPAFYETIWAFIIYGIILLLSLYYFRNQILARARYKHDIQLERIEREKASEYNDMKLRFFTNISHEFRTPLTLILGPLKKLLSLHKANNKDKEQLMLIQAGSKRLLRLVNQLMEFRKVETGNLEIKVTRKDIISLLKEIALLFKSKLVQNKIKYSLTIPVKAAYVWFDENIIETIVYNLLSNAFKFTQEKGKVQLIVEFLDSDGNPVIPNEKNERYMKIIISDTGVGIQKERIDTIFKRFYQIGTSEELKRGTGIGLALCKDLVELHHGEITVQSEENIGTKFTIKLPVHISFFTEKELEKSTSVLLEKEKVIELHDKETEIFFMDEDISSIEFTEPSTSNAEKILIIEDDIELMKYVGNMLEGSYKILTANNGNKGLELAIKEEPKLIISDILMPEMDGFELCEKIKTDIRISHIPVILLTALSSIDDKIKGLSIGADEYISKPFHPEHLIIRVNKLIEQREQLKKHFQKEFQIKPDTSNLPSIDEKFINKVMDYIENNISEPDLSVENISNEIGISSTHLYRKIKSLIGLSTNELIRKVRIKKAAELLLSNQKTISQVMYDVGFSSHSYFAKCFHEEFGLTPKEYLAKQVK